MKKYIVVNDLDNEELAEFDNVKDAKKFIKELKRFDKEENNPFDESYSIIIEEE